VTHSFCEVALHQIELLAASDEVSLIVQRTLPAFTFKADK